VASGQPPLERRFAGEGLDPFRMGDDRRDGRKVARRASWPAVGVTLIDEMI
jgi:hypothetical protein